MKMVLLCLSIRWRTKFGCRLLFIVLFIDIEKLQGVRFYDVSGFRLWKIKPASALLCPLSMLTFPQKKKEYADLKVSNAGNNSWVLLLCLVGQMTLQSWCRRWARNLSQLCTNRPFVQVYSWGAPLGDQRRSRCYKVPLTICSFAIECLRSFLVPVADLESIICFHCFMKLKNKRLCPLH
jgi:hypothetical protein